MNNLLMPGGIHCRKPLQRISSSYRLHTPHVTCSINPNHSTHPIISSLRSARSSFALPSSHHSSPFLSYTFTCPICKHHHHHHRNSHTRTLSTTGGNGGNNNNKSNNNNSGGGDDNNNDDNSNDNDSDPSSSSSSTAAAAATASYVAVQPPTFALEDVILLDVTGMRCAGCVSRVKSLLEAEPSVTSASVNIATETAMVKVRLPPPIVAVAVHSVVQSAVHPVSLVADDGTAVDIESGQGKNFIPASLSKSNQSPLALLGTSLATMLTNHGYAAAARPLDSYGSASGKIAASKREERIRKLKEATKKLAVAWILASACLAHHVTHWFGLHLPANLSWLGATSTHAGLSALALIGPGRDIVVEGFRSLWRGAPDMNSLVAMGASAAFGISAVAAGFPALGWRTFFEEPAMLLGVVLVGRALEERAKLAAGSDMAALQTLLPSKARLRIRLEQGGEEKGDDIANKNNSYKGNSRKSSSPSSSSWKEVPAEALAAGDVVVVLPGDRLPTDGIVVGGKSTVDESALTGEPLPVKKQLGDTVNAGTVNVDGRLEVETTAAGADTAVADVAQLVEAAQARSAPVQRLADAVAGKFTYGVMAAAAATFLFWATAGPRLFPQVVAKAASSASSSSAATVVITPTINAGLALALQLACNVLVVACPCALGLAAPTAVLVGTSVGAKRGLLIRGGDILEAASRVDTVVFDKTGTLTCGRPIVVDVTLTSCVTDTTTTSHNDGDGDGYGHKKNSKNSSNKDGKRWSRDELMQLAAAVEIESTHPIAKAIVASSSSSSSSSLVVGDGDRHRHGMNLLVEPGTFQQEPGSGVTAIIDNNQVSVGTIEWITSSYYNYKDTTESSNSSSSSNTILNNIIKQGPSKPGHIQVFLGINGHIEAVIEISDETRPEAARAISALKAMGLDVAMISGDQRSTAEAVASSLGIPVANVYAQVKPAGKAAIIENLQRDTAAGGGGEGGGEYGNNNNNNDDNTIIGAPTNLVASRRRRSSSSSKQRKCRVVAMVGDGVNDAAALATARVGIAMGGGVAAAAEVADVVLLGDKLTQVVDTFKLSRATFGKIKQNLWWAFAYNLIGIPLAAGAALPVAGLALTPSLSGAMMGLSSLAVMANSLTLQLYGRGEKNVVQR